MSDEDWTDERDVYDDKGRRSAEGSRQWMLTHLSDQMLYARITSIRSVETVEAWFGTVNRMPVDQVQPRFADRFGKIRERLRERERALGGGEAAETEQAAEQAEEAV